MAGSTFQPPIHLDPNQDANQQTAFINQNFQTLASALETNSFRIVKRDTTSITTTGNPLDWVTVPHNLGFAPTPFAFLNNVGISSGSSTIMSSGNIPLPTWASATIDTIKATATNSGNILPIVSFKIYLTPASDADNFYVLLFNSTGVSGSTYNIEYFLTQQSSS